MLALNSTSSRVSEHHKATPERRRHAIVTGVVLAGLAVAIYAVVLFRFAANG